MSTLYEVTGEQKLEGVPGGRITTFNIKGQSGRIFVGSLTLQDVSGTTMSVSWRASYTGPTTGYTIHERERFTEKLHAIPAVNMALKKFISEHIIDFRESPRSQGQPTERLGTNILNDEKASAGGGEDADKSSTTPPVSSQDTNVDHGGVSSSIEEVAQIFRTLSDRLKHIAAYLADDVGAQEIADGLRIKKDTLKGNFCQLRGKFKKTLPELRALFRALFAFDATLRVSAARAPDDTDAAMQLARDTSIELFGKEALSSFSPKERAVAGLLERGFSLSQIAAKTNLRLSDVGVCRKKLKQFLNCSDDVSFLSRLKDIAEGKDVQMIPPHSGETSSAQGPDTSVSSPAEQSEELLQFAPMMQIVEEFRAKLPSGYELSLGDCTAVPGGNVVSISLRVKLTR